ncbi:hypothetical protein [Terriglobus albidus]|uniref:hypothetical protein n=1 Tax=Terriglobus albidus TaxID=1592106 RepID=UPI0021E0E6CB|nr:hypothetical protein [Terriglobus albidus]
MDIHLPYNYELRIVHVPEGPNDISTIRCTVWRLDEPLDAPFGEATLNFETVLHKLENTLELSDSSLIEIMDDYMKSGCSRFRLRTTPAKLRDAELFNEKESRMRTDALGSLVTLDYPAAPPGLAKWKEMLWEANVHNALQLRDYAEKSAERCAAFWNEYLSTAESILFQRGIEF